jgi:hypothetical protein
MTDLTVAQFEVTFGRPTKGSTISDWLQVVVDDKSFYETLNDDKDTIMHLGRSSPWLEGHVVVLPVGKPVDRFYRDDEYDRVRVATHRWPSQMLDSQDYSPSRHRRQVQEVAETLAVVGDGRAVVQKWDVWPQVVEVCRNCNAVLERYGALSRHCPNGHGDYLKRISVMPTVLY